MPVKRTIKDVVEEQVKELIEDKVEKLTVKDVVEEQVKELIEDKVEQLTVKVEPKKINKVTPYKDKSWYVKWGSSFILIIGMALTAMDIQPYNMCFHLLGVAGWFIVGVWWHDRALMFINAIAMGIFFAGIVAYIN
jgi:hypothetical protein